MSRRKNVDLESDETLVDRLYSIRLSEGLDKLGMAGQLRVDSKTYYKYESGERRPGQPILIRIAQRFGVSLDWLILGEGVMYRDQQLPVSRMDEREKELSRQHGEAMEKQKEAAGVQYKELREQVKQLQTEAEAMTEDRIPGIKPDIKELALSMERIPLLYHEVMVQYQRFKMANESLFTAAPAAE